MENIFIENIIFIEIKLFVVLNMAMFGSISYIVLCRPVLYMYYNCVGWYEAEYG